jgi:D-alanyl-D-alanine carboxypeptidase
VTVRAIALTVATLLATAAPAAGKGIAPLTEDGQPNVQAEAAIVLDAATGAEYYSKDADEVRHIASTGKIFVAMVVRKKKIDLDGVTEINKVDAKYARGGARTRLMVRHSFKNIDLLRAMLVASDNRAPTALGRAVGLTPDQLIAEMNALAGELGLVKTKFTDPSGLNGNVSTAREMAIALAAALKDPVLAEILGTHEVTVTSIHSRPRRIHYRNTNRSLRSQRYPVLGGKTGYTTPAGYCLIISAKLSGRTLVMSFLGTRQKLTRFGDFNRVAKWFLAGGAGAATAAHVGAAAPEPL